MVRSKEVNTERRKKESENRRVKWEHNNGECACDPLLTLQFWIGLK